MTILTSDEWRMSKAMTTLSIGGGSVIALALAYGTSTSLKQAGVVITLLFAVGLYAILSHWDGLTEAITLFGMAASLALSIKLHLIFRADHLGGAIGYRISITEVLATVLLFVIWTTKKERTSWKLSIDAPIAVSFGVYFAWAFLSTLAARDVELGMFELSALLQSFLLFVLLSNVLITKRRVVIFVAGLLVGLSLQSGVALAQQQFPGKFNFGWAGGQQDNGTMNSSGSIDLPQVDVGTTIVQGAVAHRPTGLLIHPNVLALYLTITIPIGVAVLIGAKSLLIRMLAVVSLSLGLIALYLTLSRSGWAGTAVALLLCAYFRYRLRIRLDWKFRLVIAAGVILMLGMVAAQSGKIMNRITGTAEEAVDFRLTLARAAIQMTQDHPALGIGLNNFTDFIEQYDGSGMSHYIHYPVHMLYLLEASETGIPGGIAFVIFVAVTCIHGLQLTRRIRVAEYRILGAFLVAGFAGFWLAEFSGFVYRIPVITSYLWCCLALLCALPKLDPEVTQ
jgi:O-antigen ligase